MDFEEIIYELEGNIGKRKKNFEKTKSYGCPVIIFGAGEMAKWVMNHLDNHGIPVAGYAVDAEFFKPNQKILNRPVYNFAEISAQADKYIFVLGMEDEMQGGHRALDFLCDEKIVSYPLPINLSGSCEKLDIDFVKNNSAKFQETLDLLEDDLSRQTFSAYLRLKLTEDWKSNLSVYRPSSYFNELSESAGGKGGGYVDCGAYCGDTIARFISWSGGNYGKIFAIEPDPKNFARLEKFVQDNRYKNIVLFNCGVWNEKSTIHFESEIERSRASESGTIEVPAEKLDDLVGNEIVDFIKVEVQGSELNALKGATFLLKNQMPVLSVNVFHNAKDLITIPQFIKSAQPAYKFYLRKHTRIRDNGLVLYAIPRLAKKKLLILGGNYVDRKLVTTAKETGIVTYITDIVPIEKSPAKFLADYKYEYNSADTETIINLCRRKKIDGVLSLYHDFSQTPCRIICEKLGLPHFGDKAQYDILTNKILFKQFCEEAGLGTIPYYASQDFENNSNIDYPVIVKPCDGRGSKGQTICYSRDEVLRAIEFAKSFSRVGDVVIEKYLGQKNDLELAYIVIDGEPVLVKIGDRFLGDKASGLESSCIASVYPSKYENFYREKINPKVVEGLKKLNLRNAPIFLQGFLCGDTIRFYDPGIRLPGDDFDVGYKVITGIDVPKMFVEFALTGKFPPQSAEKIKSLTIDKFKQCMAMILPGVRAGKIKSIRGVEEIEKNPRIVSFATFYREGDEVKNFHDSRQRFAEFIIVGKSARHLKDTVEWLFETLKVLDEDGNDMLTARFDVNYLDEY